MSTTYLITLIAPHKLTQMSDIEFASVHDFIINPNDILERLKTLWKDIQIIAYEKMIEWEYKGDEGTISGSIRRDKNISSMSHASTKYMVEVAKIYRDVVPDKYTIYLFHLGEPKPIVLRGGAVIKESNFFSFRT